MDKKVLEELAAKKREVKDLEERIAKTRREIDRLGKMIVSDTVKGTRPDGTYGPIKITGLEKRSLSRRRNTLVNHQKNMEAAKAREEKKTCEAELYIESIEDSDMRTILRLRCIDELSWKQISTKMGKGYTEENCKKKYSRFMQG